MAKLTKDQQRAIKRLWERHADGSPTYLHFRRRVRRYFGDYAGIEWRGMFVGVETDGYTHT